MSRGRFGGLSSVSDDGNRQYSLRRFGRVEQAQRFANAQMSAGYPAMSIPGHEFSREDIGKTVGIVGPGAGSPTGDFSVLANDGVLAATILSVSGDTAVLSAPPSQSASGCPCIIGWPIDDAVTAAIAQCAEDYAEDGVAGMVVIPGGQFVASRSQPVQSGVGFVGAGRRDGTHVYVVKVTDDANDAVKSAWIRRPGGGEVLKHINITQLTLDGTFLAASSNYGPDMKMIHMDTTDASYVTWCAIKNNPSTALGYDGSTDCELGHNLIVRAGRLARPSTSGSSGGAGGSAIGVAVGSASISMKIHHNRIRGSLAAGMTTTAAGATGRSGINIEASANTPNPPAFGGDGLIVESNVIDGYYNGIVDSGSTGARYVNNIVRRCVHGLKAASNGVTYGRMARDAVFLGNDVSDLFTWNNQYAAGIMLNSAPGATASGQSGIGQVYARARCKGNTIRRVAGGYGIVLIGSASNPLAYPHVEGNLVSDCDLSGMRFVGTIIEPKILNNDLVSNGRAGVVGNRAPMRFDAGTVITGGRFSGNTYSDPEAVPTQDASPSYNNATFTGTTVSDGVLFLPQGTVANLPAATAAYRAFRATVIDASVAYTAANVGSVVAGGGANSVPVFCNGAAWVIG